MPIAEPEELTELEAAALRRDWKLLAGITFLFGFGFAVYSGVFQNYLRDVMKADALMLGQLESLREIPGLLAALLAGLVVALAEAKIAALGLLVGAIGIGVTGWMPSYLPLIAITVFWSVGLHLYLTVQPAITLSLARGKEGGRHLGRMTGVGAAATIGGLALAWGTSLALPKLPYWVYFAFGGVMIFAASFLCAELSTHADGGVRQRIVFRKEYGLYYFLIFLEGCRRQIFSIFASFALILVYHVPLSHMLALQFINAILIWLTAPWIGKLIDRIGEKNPLTFYALGLIVVFLGYAISRRVEALYALFLIDNILFSFGIGFNTYLHRIVRPGEMTPCLAMGITMNHVAAVTVPVGGAYLWKESGNYQLPFWVGVGIAAISLVATRWLPGATPNTPTSTGL